MKWEHTSSVHLLVNLLKEVACCTIGSRQVHMCIVLGAWIGLSFAVAPGNHICCLGMASLHICTPVSAPMEMKQLISLVAKAAIKHNTKAVHSLATSSSLSI